MVRKGEVLYTLSKEYHFLFRIIYLGIETSFKIGNTEIRYFSDKEIGAYYDELKDSGKFQDFESFKKAYDDDFKYINAFAIVKGVLKRATEIALREVELSIDVLKCFCTEHAVNEYCRMFDIDFRSTQGDWAHYLYLPHGDIEDATRIHQKINGVIPIMLDNNFVKNAEKKGLIEFSRFLTEKKDSELYYYTLDLIKQFSLIVSTRNNYEKIVKMISLFESVCVPKNSAKAKGETILKNKVAPKILSSEEYRNIFCNLVRYHYNVRDKYLHNWVQLELDVQKLYQLMEFQRLFILNIILLNEKYNSLDDIISYFEII